MLESLMRRIACIGTSRPLVVSGLAMLAEPDGILGFVFLALTFIWMLLIPSVLAVQVRRMHDVGKSGWFILVPIYSLFLYVQPSVNE